VSLNLPIRNRTAQADAARSLLEQRQMQMKLQNAKNQAVWDVSKAVSGMEQAKSQLDAALELAALSRQVLDMQQQKFTLAVATMEEVITAQGNLATAEGNVVKARANYAKALVQYEQATGTLLERNNIELDEAVQGEVHRVPNIPGSPRQSDYQGSRASQTNSICLRAAFRLKISGVERQIVLNLARRLTGNCGHSRTIHNAPGRGTFPALFDNTFGWWRAKGRLKDPNSALGISP
jgi:hypothetical protein